MTIYQHANHPFYAKVDSHTDRIKRQQIQKGYEKYPEPFNPDSWTEQELADHALQELRDGQVYTVGMLDRMEKQKKTIDYLLDVLRNMKDSPDKVTGDECRLVAAMAIDFAGETP